MLEYSYKTVCDNSNTDLYANGARSCAFKFLYIEMMFETFEENLNYNRQIHLYSFFNSDVQKMFFWPIKKHLKIV